ncbi:hypothetical protein [Mucilaginibacter sp.]|uniref:hypothetical protein n=1 Tax=Mucilaginibacter sp. TaxID=1882438 RepID=UPI00283DEC86|nr:hypothetical protein [Mucilaginibacter sp.]MDR3693978.1 hypothetical protein [Mucilaginibacter sp.]
MGKVKSQKINYGIPGSPMDQQEFEQMIRDAEKGPFYTVAEVKAEMAKWKARNLLGANLS